MSKAKVRKSNTGAKALAGISALRDRITKEVPEFAEAVQFEQEAEEFCQSIRDELRKRRKLKNLDQEELGELIGLTQSAVSRIERNRGDIGLKSIYRYARALGLRPFITFAPSAEDLLGAVIFEPSEFSQFGKDMRRVAARITDEQTKLMQSVSEDVAEIILSLADVARTDRRS